MFMFSLTECQYLFRLEEGKAKSKKDSTLISSSVRGFGVLFRKSSHYNGINLYAYDINPITFSGGVLITLGYWFTSDP